VGENPPTRANRVERVYSSNPRARTGHHRDKRLVSKMQRKTNSSRWLQAVRNGDRWAFGNHWRRV